VEATAADMAGATVAAAIATESTPMIEPDWNSVILVETWYW